MDELALPALRSLERIMVVGGGILCLWLGARLFERDAAARSQSMELSYKEVLVRLRARGPAIFYALFGSAILIGSLINPVEIGRQGKGSVSLFKGLGPKELELTARQLQALNVVYQISRIPPSDSISEADRKSLARTTNDLQHIRAHIVSQIVGNEKFEVWRRVADDAEKRPDLVVGSDRKTYDEVQKYFNDLGPFK